MEQLETGWLLCFSVLWYATPHATFSLGLIYVYTNTREHVCTPVLILSPLSIQSLVSGHLLSKPCTSSCELLCMKAIAKCIIIRVTACETPSHGAVISGILENCQKIFRVVFCPTFSFSTNFPLWQWTTFLKCLKCVSLMKWYLRGGLSFPRILCAE